MQTKSIYVAFRFDDPSTISPVELEKKLIGCFHKYGYVCAFGIIPCVTDGDYHDPNIVGNLPLTEEKIKLYKEANNKGAIDIILHGYEHRTIAQPGQLHSEFCGLPYESQLDKIQNGKKFLEEKLETKITSFIPPWNTYDENTLRALSNSGIYCISANRCGVSNPNYDIAYIPITIELGDLKEAVAKARQSKDQDVGVVVLMHPYDFSESGDERGQFSVQDLDDYLKWLSDQDDVHCSYISHLSAEKDRFNFKRYHANYPSKLEKVYPGFVTRTVDSPLYQSAGYARLLKKSKELGTLLVHASVLCAAALAIYFIFGEIFPIPKTYSTISVIILMGFIAFLLMGAFRNREIYFKRLFVLNGVIGILLGLAIIL